jgi:Protein of unknown function (DUF3570)
VKRLLILFALLSAAHAFADENSQITMRGNYWRDRNTRVIQPEAALTRELPTGTILGAHYLLDTITSASIAAGASADKVFTELRNEAGFSLAQRIKSAILSTSYSYSSESDYWAHFMTFGGLVDLFQKNTTLALTLSYGINSAAQRAGATVYVPVGKLQTFGLIASWTQVLSERLIGSVEYDLNLIGFGDKIGDPIGTPTKDSGYQANPYRSVNLGGSPARESVPFQRLRQSAALTLRWLIPIHNPITPYLVLRPSYRIYWDDWGLVAHTPELRFHLPVGPVEFRLTGRYYTQNAVSFSSLVDGSINYANGQGKACTTCLMQSTRQSGDGSARLYYTSDPKLYAWDSFFLEARLAISLRGLARFRKLPLHDWLAAGVIELSYGHYFDTKVAHQAYGDADLAGLAFQFPL